MNEANTTQPTAFVRPHFRAYDSYYHANAKGTGSACKISLHPAHDEVAGSIFVSIAPQSKAGDIVAGSFPTFSWNESLSVKLDRNDLSHILQVLRGIKESIQDDKGLFHRSSAGTTVIKFEHNVDPCPCYILKLHRKTPAGEKRDFMFVFDMNEAFALMVSLEHALMYVSFGIPEVIKLNESK